MYRTSTIIGMSEMTEDIKKQLITLFEATLVESKDTERSTYKIVFEELRDKYKPLINEIKEQIKDADEKDKDSVVTEIASVIPDYAQEKIQKISNKHDREDTGIDYNMDMAVYVIPLFTYTRDDDCQMVADKMVEIWNKRDITSLTLSASTYEDIDNGYKFRLCYITTAVCKSQNKPDDCYELMALRSYRDTYLMQSEEGRALVEAYYEVAPLIVLIINMQENAAQIYDEIYREYIIPCLRAISMGEQELCKKQYIQMVQELKKRYI